MTRLARIASKPPMTSHAPLWRILGGWNRNDRFDIADIGTL